jgi:prepilin-type N-terminal cleavage/methylation domain-containing protein
MNEFSPASSAPRSNRGFTLIEMLVVIAIIGLLAGMIVPLASLVSKKKILARTRIEVDNLCLAIDTYKAKKGIYPPDNATLPAGPFTNQLFYELWGMVVQSAPPPPNPLNPLFTNTFNAHEVIDAKTLQAFFGTSGVVNSSTDTNEIRNFISTLNAAEIQNINVPGPYPVWVFATPAVGPLTAALPVGAATHKPVNVIRYVSSSPTNNPNSYDLWVDVLIGGKTNRISNWSRDSQIVNN